MLYKACQKFKPPDHLNSQLNRSWGSLMIAFKSKGAVEETFLELESKFISLGLTVNGNKTKYMVTGLR